MTRFRPIAEPQMAQHEQSSVMACAKFQYLQESLDHVKLASSAVASQEIWKWILFERQEARRVFQDCDNGLGQEGFDETFRSLQALHKLPRVILWSFM